MCSGIMDGVGPWMLLVVVAVLAVLGTAVLAGIWLVRGLRPDHPGANRSALGGAGGNGWPSESGAHEVLRRRYAAGEIDDEEYERRLSGLTWR